MRYIHHPPSNCYRITEDKPLPNEREITAGQYYENSIREFQVSQLKDDEK